MCDFHESKREAENSMATRESPVIKMVVITAAVLVVIVGIVFLTLH